MHDLLDLVRTDGHLFRTFELLAVIPRNVPDLFRLCRLFIPLLVQFVTAAPKRHCGGLDWFLLLAIGPVLGAIRFDSLFLDGNWLSDRDW